MRFFTHRSRYGSPMTGFGFNSTTDDVLDGVDLSTQRVLVTGGSTGLGEETARALAAHGANVTLGVRDLARGEAARQRILERVPDAELELLEIDLADLSSVRRAATEFLERHERLDVLINNAGLMACPQGTTVDGFELQWGTNHLGHFLLANLLLPALRAASPSRVVSLTSGGHTYSDIDLDDPNFERTAYNPFTAYGRAKTANALFAVGWDRRFGTATEEHRGIHAFSVHPGGIHTELGRHMTPEVIAELRASLRQSSESAGREKFAWKSIPQGAATSVWAATAAELDDHGGAYLEDCSVAEEVAHKSGRGYLAYAADPASADRLWAYSLAAVGLPAQR